MQTSPRFHAMLSFLPWAPRPHRHSHLPSPLPPETLILHEHGSPAPSAGLESYDAMEQHHVDIAKGAVLTVPIPQTRAKPSHLRATRPVRERATNHLLLRSTPAMQSSWMALIRVPIGANEGRSAQNFRARYQPLKDSIALS